MDSSINLGIDEYLYIIQHNLSNNNLNFSAMEINASHNNDNIEHIDIFESPKKRTSMDLEISYTDEQYNFENTFEVENQERDEPCSNY